MIETRYVGSKPIEVDIVENKNIEKTLVTLTLEDFNDLVVAANTLHANVTYTYTPNRPTNFDWSTTTNSSGWISRGWIEE